jgi:exonuclease SbcD
MKPFSFVHVADIHLGYSQYNLEARREDFSQAFLETVEKTVELHPDFMIIAGDIFHRARPSNSTLESAIKGLATLRNSGIPVLTVDGSHDSAPNLITGTILIPLDAAGLLCYLPRREGACWRNESCYVYGVPNFRSRQKTEEQLPQFFDKNEPTPDPSLFNIFVFHMALDIPKLKHPQMEAEAPPELIPEGFNYYSGGHIHNQMKFNFKGGVLGYSGSTESVYYDDAERNKGFYHIKVDEKGQASFQVIKLEKQRRFLILDDDYSGMTPTKITEKAASKVEENDEEGVIIVPVLKGVLPAEVSRSDVDIVKIRNAGSKALLIHPVNRLTETEMPEEVVQAIFEGHLKDLKTKAYEYFLNIFSEHHSKSKAERIARLSVEIMDSLTRKDDEKTRETLEIYLNEN